MKPLTKILIAILVLTAIVPFKLALLCIMNPGDAISFFDIATVTPEIEKLLIVTGCFVLATVAFQLVAAWWLVTGKAAGFDLAVFTGCIAIGRGALMLLLLKSHDSNDIRISIVPIVFGTLILVFSIIAAKRHSAV